MNESYDEIKNSCELCNHRMILMDEIRIFNQKIEETFYDDDGFKRAYFQQNAHYGIVLLLAFLVSFGIEYLLMTEATVMFPVPGLFTIILTISVLLTYRYWFWLFHGGEVKRYAQYRQQAIEAKDTYRELMEEKKQELQQLLLLMEDEQRCCIPQYYWNDANSLLWYLQNKRARNLTDAINLLEHEKKEEEMLRYQRRQAEASEAAAYSAQITAENSAAAAESAREAATAAGIGAMFSALNYFSSRDS